MNLLLDTHIFLWLITNDPQLSTKARLAIEDGNNEVFLGAVSVWEITIKYKLGKYGGPVCQDSPGPLFKKFLPSFRGLGGLRFRSPCSTLFRA